MQLVLFHLERITLNEIFDTPRKKNDVTKKIPLTTISQDEKNNNEQNNTSETQVNNQFGKFFESHLYCEYKSILTKTFE